MKKVKEHIDEKFEENSDPIQDLGIGGINFWDMWAELVILGLEKWFNLLKEMYGKKITITTTMSARKETFVLREIRRQRGSLYYILTFIDDEGNKYQPDLRERIIIHNETNS